MIFCKEELHQVQPQYGMVQPTTILRYFKIWPLVRLLLLTSNNESNFRI